MINVNFALRGQETDAVVIVNDQEVGYVFYTQFDKWRSLTKNGFKSFLADTKEEAIQGLLEKIMK